MRQDNYILVENINYNRDGKTIITGKNEATLNLINLQLNPEILRHSTLRINNISSKTQVNAGRFKLSDITKVMKNQGWHKASFLIDLWLKSAPLAMKPSEKGNWSDPTTRNELYYYNPNKFNHDWLRGFQRYKDTLNRLTYGLLSPNGSNEIAEALNSNGIFEKFKSSRQDSYRGSSSLVNIRNPSIDQLKAYHKNWQTQFKKVDNGFMDKVSTLITSGIDDLWAAFGAFAIYAGIGEYSIRKSNDNNWYEVKLHSIFVYAIDSYDFIVNEAAGHDNDYLGHWNQYEFAFFSLFQKEPRISIRNSQILFPVFNQDFLDYRKKLSKGRDMIIWTKPHLIDISNIGNKFNTTRFRVDYINSL